MGWGVHYSICASSIRSNRKTRRLGEAGNTLRRMVLLYRWAFTIRSVCPEVSETYVIRIFLPSRSAFSQTSCADRLLHQK